MHVIRPNMPQAALAQVVSQLRARERRVAGLFDDAAIGIALIDLDGLVVAANPAWRRLLGLSAGDLTGRHVLEFADPIDAVAARARLTALLDGKVLTFDIEHRMRGADGLPQWADVTVSLVREGDGRPACAVGIAHDITEKKDLQRQVATAALEEQQRIGQELHDDPAQTLSGVAMEAFALVRSLRAEASPHLAAAERILFGLDDAQRRLRALARNLMSIEVGAGGLRAALTELAASADRPERPCLARFEGAAEIGDATIETQLLRIAQEGLRNALRHSGATRIEVLLAGQGERLSLEVRDNGQSFDPSAAHAGIGLHVMRHRADAIHAELSIESPAADGGTRVRCVLAAPG
ncbi:MAG: PAS domain S-box protein [Myxococcales bacterium]|nr:PAS domain S-box protein [Myxococcales bacterium]